MSTVQHYISPDYPNGKTETAKMFAYAAEIGLWANDLHHGDHVEILKGGYRGDFATVRSLHNDYLSLTHSSGCILSGFHKNDVRRVVAT